MDFKLDPVNQTIPTEDEKRNADEVRLLVKGGPVVLPIVRGTLKSSKLLGGLSRSVRYECGLRCFIRTGRQDNGTGAVENGIALRFTVDPSARFDDVTVDSRRVNRDPVPSDDFIRVFAPDFGSILVTETNRTPLAERIGLLLAETEDPEEVKISLELVDGKIPPLFPVYRRVVHLERRLQTLGPFQFRIPRELTNVETWTLTQKILPPPASIAAAGAPVPHAAFTSWRDSMPARKHLQPREKAQNATPALPRWLVTLEAPARAAFSSWNTQIASPLVHYFQNDEGDARLSSMPRLTEAETGEVWNLSIAIGEDDQDRNNYYLRASDLVVVPYLLAPKDDQAATLVLDAMTRHDGQPLSAKATIGAPQNAMKEWFGSSSFEVRKLNCPAQVVRIGSLDLTFNGRLPLTGKVRSIGTITAAHSPASPGTPVGDQPNDESRTPSLRVQLNDVQWPVSRVEPGGEDDPPDSVGCVAPVTSDTSRNQKGIEKRFAHETPLIIPSGAPLESVRLTLIFKESVGVQQSHEVELSLTGTQLGIENARYMVLDRTPFLVAAVTMPRLSRDATSTEIAHWGHKAGSALPNQGQWQARARGTVLADIALPPQALGEQTEKRKNLGDNDLADFRLSTAGKVQLRLSRPDESAVTFPWNLRRLFGYPGSQSPGTELTQAKFELLYGLATTVTYPTPADREITLRIAEIASRFGEVQPCLPSQNDTKDDYGLFWADVYARYQSRLAALELFNDSDPTRQLELDRWLHFGIRPQADVADPFMNPPPPGKLQGGALWGFEFLASYQAVMSQPETETGVLKAPFLSALGGWGFQKASFANGIVSIYSDTAMGRAFYYSVEELGRINCVWNRAKHVVVYERTVAATKQFADSQNPLFGRPVIRKVLEYVEILQTRREYPDDSATDPRMRGFVQACEFKSKIILVNSAWGSDIGPSGNPDGFQIPLWRPSENPDVYPKPLVILEMAAQEHTPPAPPDPNAKGAAGTTAPPPSAGRPGVTQYQIDEPEKLIFYSLPKQPTSDTDQWPVVVGIDSMPYDQPARTKNSDRMKPRDESQPDDRPVERGFSKLTFALAPGPDRVNLVAGRAQSGGMNALVHNVTLARQSAVRFEKSLNDKIGLLRTNDPATKLKELRDKLQAQAQGQSTIDQTLRDKWKNVVDGSAKDLSILNDALKSGGYSLGMDLCANAQQALKKQLNDEVAKFAATELPKLTKALQDALFPAPIGADLKSERAKCVANVNGWFDQRRKEIAALVGLATQLGGDLTKLTTELTTAIKNLKVKALGYLAQFDAAVTDAQNRYTRAINQIATADLIANIRRETKDIQSAVAPFKAAVDAALDQVLTLAQTTATVVSVAGAQSRPLDGFLKQLVGDATAARSAFDAQAQVFLSGLDAIEKTLEAEIAKGRDAAIAAIQVWADGWRKASNDVRTTINSLVATLTDDLNVVKNFPRGPIQALNEALEQLELARRAALASIDQAFRMPTKIVDEAKKQVALAVQDGFKAASAKFKEFGDQIAQFADDLCKQLVKDVTDLLADAVSALDTAEIKKWIDGLTGSVADALKELDEDVQEVANNLDAAWERLIQTASADASKLANVLDSAVQKGFQLIRAFGDVPAVPELDFNCKQLAYFFNGLEQVGDKIVQAAEGLGSVLINGATGLLNRAGQDLKGLDLRLPFSALGDHLLPDFTDAFDLGSLLPNFGGLNLEHLFPHITLNQQSAPWFVVTHGMDPQTRRAWVRAQIKDLRLPDDPATLWDRGFTIRIANTRFNAQADAQIGLDAHVEKTFQGSISGNWIVGFAGTDLVTFRDTTLSYDQNGKLHFDLQLKNVELSPHLSAVTEALKQIAPGNGFTLQPFLPAGVQVNLDLEFPNLGGVTTGISHLGISVSFLLRVIPEFSIGCRAGFGRREKPFVMAVFILGGTGWVEAGLTYAPKRNALAIDVDIGIGLSASLQIALGPISGEVGISLSFVLTTRNPDAAVNTWLRLLIWGEVQVLCLASARVELDFKAQYQSGCLNASGQIEIHIKICWFLEINISVGASYSLGNCSSSQRRAALARAEAARGDDEFDTAACQFIEQQEES